MGRAVKVGVFVGSLAVSVVLYMFSWHESHVARAERAALTLDITTADSVYAVLEEKTPDVFGMREKIVIRRKELLYRRGDYQAILGDSIFEREELHPRLHAVFAHAIYRSIASEKDRQTVLAALDNAIFHYQSAGIADTHEIDHAYNYEFLRRVQKNVQDRKQKLPLGDMKKAAASKQGQEKGQGDLAAESMHGVEGTSSGEMPQVRMRTIMPREEEGTRSEEGPSVGKGNFKKKPG